MEIKSEEEYQAIMKEIDSLMKIGEENLSDEQVQRIKSLSEAAERYEDTQLRGVLPA